MKRIGIVVVTYNRLPLLKQVVESLRNQTCTDGQIIVVNNGSTDDTLNWLQRQDDIITITQENLGGAGGFHRGMKYVAENGYEYCWVMDDDVICNPAALEELMMAYDVKANIGFVCSKVVGVDGCPMNTPKVDCRAADNGYSNYYELSDHNMIKVVMATFVSVLIHTSVICEVGLPYKEYFIWGDDFEYTERISSKYDCYVACNSIVVHKRRVQERLSFDKEKDPSRLINYFYAFRNTFHRYAKDASRIRFFLRYNKLAFRCISMLLKGHPQKAKIIAKALWAILTFSPAIEYPQVGKGK
jgi:GT2 family glycosyltransferase